MLIKPKILIHAENSPSLMEGIVSKTGDRIFKMVEAATALPLNRYNLRSGRIFGIIHNNQRFKIVELVGGTVVYKDLNKDKIFYAPVDDVLQKWNLMGVVEISGVDAILEKIKSVLTPFLGGVLVAALLSWLLKKLGK